MISLKTILVATDFSEPSDAALRYGKDLARAYGASLHVLHVVDDLAVRVSLAPMAVTPDLGTLQTELETGARQSLDRLLTDEDRRVLRAKPMLLTSSRPGDSILSYARDANADLIVIGTHGRTGVAHLFMGSVAERVARLAPCPVLTVRHPEREFVHSDALQAVTAAI